MDQICFQYHGFNTISFDMKIQLHKTKALTLQPSVTGLMATMVLSGSVMCKNVNSALPPLYISVCDLLIVVFLLTH